MTLPSGAPTTSAGSQRCQAGLAALLAHLGDGSHGALPFAELLKRWERFREARGGWTPLAQALGLPPALIAEQLNPAMRQLNSALKEAPAGSTSAITLQIAELRLLDVFEQIREANPAIDIDTRLPDDEGQEERDRMRCFKQVRALELVLRGLIDEAYGEQSRLLARLAELRGDDQVATWRKVADPGDVLSGTGFGDLSNLIVDKQEYSQHYDSLFKHGSYLNFLKGQRATLQRFLDDIRRMRNQVAHHKKVTQVQMRLLDLYYAEIVSPLQLAFDEGDSRVNPDRYFDASAEEIQDWLQKLDTRLAKVGDDVVEIKDTLGAVAVEVGAVRRGVQDVKADTGWLRGKLVWVLAGVAAVAVIVVLTLGTSSRTLLNTDDIKIGVSEVDKKVALVKKESSDDPRKELSNRGVAWTDNSLRDAIRHGEVDNTRLFLAGGMHWRVGWLSDALRDSMGGTLALLTSRQDLLDPAENHSSGCGSMQSQLARQPAITAVQGEFLKGSCGGPAEIAHAKGELERMRAFYASQRKAYDAALAQVRPASACEHELMAGGGQSLLQEASTFSLLGGRLTMTHRDEMLAELQMKVMIGRPVRPAELTPIVDRYCERQASEKPNIALDDEWVNGWERVLKASAR